MLRVVRDIHASASSRVDWLTNWSELHVSRLDLVRTFEGIDDIHATLQALARVPLQRAPLQKVFNDPKRGGVETLNVYRPGRWSTTAYDKAEEMLRAASRTADRQHREDLRDKAGALRQRGHLRTEMSVRTKRLRELHQTTRLLDLLQEELMNATAERHFRAAGLHSQVGGRQKVAAVLREIATGPSSGILPGLVLMLTQEALGLPVTASPNSIDAYRALAKRHGLSAADFHLEDHPQTRLDWNSGVQVAGAVA